MSDLVQFPKHRVAKPCKPSTVPPESRIVTVTHVVGPKSKDRYMDEYSLRLSNGAQIDKIVLKMSSQIKVGDRFLSCGENRYVQL